MAIQSSAWRKVFRLGIPRVLDLNSSKRYENWDSCAKLISEDSTSSTRGSTGIKLTRVLGGGGRLGAVVPRGLEGGGVAWANFKKSVELVRCVTSMKS